MEGEERNGGGGEKKEGGEEGGGMDQLRRGNATVYIPNRS